jgi:SHAQKYF class myb-like DNA-binding protein
VPTNVAFQGAYPHGVFVDKSIAMRTTPTPIAPLGEAHLDKQGVRSSLKLKIKKKHVNISPRSAYTLNATKPIAPSPSGVKIPLEAGPPADADDGDDESIYEDESVSSANSAALRGGRWTSEEHERFLAGFRLHGHKWKRVQMVVRSRTVTQVRTHAQKYLLKLQKMSGDSRASETGSNQISNQYSSGATSPTASAPDDTDCHDRQSWINVHGTSASSPVSLEVTHSGWQEGSYSPSMLDRTPKKSKPVLKKSKRTHRAETEAIYMEAAAYTLCTLMNLKDLEDLEGIATDHEDNLDCLEGANESMSPLSEDNHYSSNKKRYLCRKCRVPKKGHICEATEDDATSVNGPHAVYVKDLNEDVEVEEDNDEPLRWDNITQLLGHQIVRCVGRDTWYRGKISAVMPSTNGEEDKIHVVYSESPNEAEWLVKTEAIECVALEKSVQDGQMQYEVFPGSSLKKRKLFGANSVANQKRVCSPL